MMESTVLENKLEELRQAYREKLPREIEHIDALWKKLLHVKWDNNAFSLLHRLVHNLAGTAGTHGYPNIGNIASKLDQQLQKLEDTQNPPSEHDRLKIKGQLQKLTESISSTSPMEVSAAGVNLTATQIESIESMESMEKPSRRTRVLVLEDDADHIEIIQLYLKHHGCDVRVTSDVGSLLQAVSEQSPDIMLLDVMLPGSPNAGIDIVKQLQAGAADIPILFMSARGDLEVRLAAVRTGGEGYLVKPFDMSELLHKIDCLMDATNARYRLMIVNDNKDLAVYHAEVLKQSGMITHVVTSSLKVLEELDVFQPDLILMDLHMPECSGGELAQIIRQESHFANLPILFVSGERDPDRQNAALAQGGDAFLVNPVTDSQLIEAATNRVKRARILTRRLKHLEQQDPETGLINQRTMIAHLNTAINELSGAGTAAALLYIEIDHFVKVRGEIGFLQSELMIVDVADIIRREIGPSEQIARIGNSHFVVLLTSVNSSTALTVSNWLRKTIEEQVFKAGSRCLKLTISIGVASLNERCRNGDEWLNAAAIACETKGEGVNESYLHKPIKKEAPVQEAFDQNAELL